MEGTPAEPATLAEAFDRVTAPKMDRATATRWARTLGKPRCWAKVTSVPGPASWNGRTAMCTEPPGHTDRGCQNPDVFTVVEPSPWDELGAEALALVESEWARLYRESNRVASARKSQRRAKNKRARNARRR